MARQDLERFREAVLEDTTLQEQLKSAQEHEEFILLTTRLGAERGYAVTQQDVEEALRESRREWLMRWI